MVKRRSITLMVISLLCLITACSGGSGNITNEVHSNSAYNDINYNKNIEVGINADNISGINNTDGAFYNNAGNNEIAGIENEKIIYNIQLEVETLDYNNSNNYLVEKIKGYGGYIQSADVPRKSITNSKSLIANYVFMIPASKIDEIVNSVGDIGTIRVENRISINVTDEYIDLEARIVNLSAKENRILELLERAVTLDEILLLENSISSTRYEIEKYSARIRDFDKRIEYTEMAIKLIEVVELSDVVAEMTLWEKIGEQFEDRLEEFKNFTSDILIWVMGSLLFDILSLIITISPILVLVLILIIVLRRRKKNSGKKLKVVNEISTREM